MCSSTLQVDSLVPEELQSSPTAEAFLAALPDFDGQMSAKVQAAADAGKVLRYVGDRSKRPCSALRSCCRSPTLLPLHVSSLPTADGVTSGLLQVPYTGVWHVQNADIESAALLLLSVTSSHTGAGAVQAWWTAKRAAAA